MRNAEYCEQPKNSLHGGKNGGTETCAAQQETQGREL